MDAHFKIVLSIAIVFLVETVFGQGFSEDSGIFIKQATMYLRKKDTEVAKKVARDFENAWGRNFEQKQKEQVISIARDMRKLKYGLDPFFWNLFSYLSYAVEQEKVTPTDLSSMLKINRHALTEFNGDQYKEFLFGMNMYLAKRYVRYSKNLSIQSVGGSYKFEIVNPVPSYKEIEETGFNNDNPEAKGFETSILSEESGSDDNWDTNDEWGSDDDWETGSNWETDDEWSTANNGYVQDYYGDSDGDWDVNINNLSTDKNIYTPEKKDYIELEKFKYIHPLTDGPVLSIQGAQLMIVSRYDSLVIKEVDGFKVFKTNKFIVESGKLIWPRENKRISGAEVTLGKFNLELNNANFWTPNAILNFPGLLDGEVEGVFRFRSIKRAKRKNSRYPIFISYANDTKLEWDQGRLLYTGGIKIAGNDIYGESISRGNGKLELTAGVGKKVIFEGLKFEFRKDSVIKSPNSSMVIRLAEDSIYHPAVEFEYDMNKRRLTVLQKKEYDVTPFRSSYHKILLNTDLLKWSLDIDSIEFHIMQAKNLVPAVLESDEYFNKIRYRKLTGPFGFHPIAITTKYALKYGVRKFTIYDLESEYNVSRPLLTGAMKMLKKYNFINFDEVSGEIFVHDRSFHYYQASSKRKDYDNLMISSIVPKGANAVLNLDSMQFEINGVDKFYPTSSFDVSITPDDGKIKVLSNRDVAFDGFVDAEDFFFKGRDFTFKYDNFKIDLVNIDSLGIQLPPEDTTLNKNNPLNKQRLNNNLNQTSGILYLNKPDNKSGVVVYENYPYFITDSESTVYFDDPKVLNGAYDKSIRFAVAPVEIDSLDGLGESNIKFPGIFDSGEIFPRFEDTLMVQGDKSLGFVHDIPSEGYNLYGTSAKTYKKITLNNQGIRGVGRIDYLNATLFSDEFIYYMDSVTALGSSGFIRPGLLNGVSFPDAEFDRFSFKWLPKKNRMYLRTIDKPFDIYNNTAQLVGEINITDLGIFGSGEILTQESRTKSNQFSFKELSYSARNAYFEIFSDNPDKPAMEGDDIKLRFDLEKNIAILNPEQIGVAAINFPYAALKTSITNAVWELDKHVITMKKPMDVSLNDSYFYSTNKKMDSLVFSAESASYNILTQRTDIEGIPFIKVADAYITPSNKKLTVLADSRIEELDHAKMVFRNDSTYHYFVEAKLEIQSRNAFQGRGTYLYKVQNDTIRIKLDYIIEKEELINDELMSFSYSEVNIPKSRSIRIAPGFQYKGKVIFKAYKQALELTGAVQPIIYSIENNQWIYFNQTDKKKDIVIQFDDATVESGGKAIAGLHYGDNGGIYPTFIENRKLPNDVDFFMSSGTFQYDSSAIFSIENNDKRLGRQFQGQTYVYNDENHSIRFEGKVDFFEKETNEVEVLSSVLGTGNRQQSIYSVDGMMTVDYKLSEEPLELMADDILDVVETLGNPPSNEINRNLMVKIANLIGEKAALSYERKRDQGYMPLVGVSRVWQNHIVISNFKLKWDEPNKSWYSLGKLGLSSILDMDINAMMDGFMELKKSSMGADIFNLFLQASPGVWYYFGYEDNNLAVYSSNREFNESISENPKTNSDLSFIVSDENETVQFINGFRKKYLGIDEAYDLLSTNDANLEEENFETIEKPEEDDDGFGFE